jgi:hypothetical protein
VSEEVGTADPYGHLKLGHLYISGYLKIKQTLTLGFVLLLPTGQLQL